MQSEMYLFHDLLGIGGVIKEDVDDFIVTEIPLYEPCGQGEHVYLQVKRRDMNTRDVEKVLSKVLKVPMGHIGTAGLKDKYATTIQWFSVHMPGAKIENVRHALESINQFEIISVNQHKNKLKRGHLIGNTFKIKIRQVTNPDLSLLETYIKRMQEVGVPNYFGIQRMGEDFQNIHRGLAILKEGKRVHTWIDQYLVNSYQSHVFNLWLQKRIKEAGFLTPLSGDVFKKHDFGGLFVSEDFESDNLRFKQNEISYAGPLFGETMMASLDRARLCEKSLLTELDLNEASFGLVQLMGGRRVARIFPQFHGVEMLKDECHLEFTLPKGSFATVVLNEMMKV